MQRYVRLFLLQARISLSLGAQYRWDFLLQGVLSFAWVGLGIMPLYVALHDRPQVAGWTYYEALVVVGCFTILKGVLDGAINPSLTQVVEHIRKGTLDFVLMKPADAQFLVSTAKFEPWKLVDVLGGVGILIFAFSMLGVVPSFAQFALAGFLLVVAIAVLYSIWIVVVAAAFWVVRLDNLSYLLNSIIDFGRWPIGVFRGALRIVFTYVLPIALMTTYPAEALLGRLSVGTAFVAVLGALFFAALGRVVFRSAIGRYTSASS